MVDREPARREPDHRHRSDRAPAERRPPRVAAVRGGFLLRTPDVPGLFVWAPGQQPRAAHPAAGPGRSGRRALGRGDAPGSRRVADRMPGSCVRTPRHRCRVGSRRHAARRHPAVLRLRTARTAASPPTAATSRCRSRRTSRARARSSLVDLATGSVVARRDIQVRFSSTGSDTSAAAVPFDFSADSGHLVVADWSIRPGRLVVLRTADGALEHTVDGVGSVDSIASFDAVPTVPATALFSGSGPIAPLPTGRARWRSSRRTATRSRPSTSTPAGSRRCTSRTSPSGPPTTRCRGSSRSTAASRGSAPVKRGSRRPRATWCRSASRTTCCPAARRPRHGPSAGRTPATRSCTSTVAPAPRARRTNRSSHPKARCRTGS